jgi:hypothetical protein
MQNKNKFQLLCEYLTVGQDSGNKMMQGETRPEKPKHMSLQDIVDHHTRNGVPADNSASPSILPAPLTNNHISILADIYSNTVGLKSDFIKASGNPTVTDDAKLSSSIEKITGKLENICDIIKDISHDLDNFSGEK